MKKRFLLLVLSIRSKEENRVTMIMKDPYAGIKLWLEQLHRIMIILDRGLKGRETSTEEIKNERAFVRRMIDRFSKNKKNRRQGKRYAYANQSPAALTDEEQATFLYRALNHPDDKMNKEGKKRLDACAYALGVVLSGNLLRKTKRKGAEETIRILFDVATKKLPKIEEEQKHTER